MLLASDVKKAQGGDESSVLGLLFDYGYRDRGRWYGLLGKYEQLLWHGKVDLKNKDTRRFLQLYITDIGVREKLTWSRYSDSTKQAAQFTANHLQADTQAYWTRHELRQELVYVFLDCLNRYTEQPGVSFSGYLANYYRYRLYYLLSQTVFRKTHAYEFEHVSLVDTGDLSTLPIDPSNWPNNAMHAAELERDELGVFWTNGLCGPPFESLTAFERILLRDHYLLKRTDEAMGDRYGYHRNTIRKRRHAAAEKVKAYTPKVDQ